MASVDIQKAHLYIPKCTPHQCFLHFAVRDQHFYAIALLFRLHPTPQVLTKVLVPRLVHLHTQDIPVTGYLDDLLLKDSSATNLSAAGKQMILFLQIFGWIINFPKSAFQLSHLLEFLSLILDTA